MSILKSILLSTVILSISTAIFASDPGSKDTDQDFFNQPKITNIDHIIADIQRQQLQLEKEIENMAASMSDDRNQIKLSKNCKQPNCHYYNESSFFTITPDQKYTYQNTISTDGQTKRVNLNGNIPKNKYLILNNAEGKPQIYLDSSVK